jgi:hypothetical protein
MTCRLSYEPGLHFVCLHSPVSELKEVDLGVQLEQNKVIRQILN